MVQSGSYPVSILDLEQSYHCIAGSGDKAMGVSLGMAAVDTKKSSNVFQMICLWLTKNKLDLVLKIIFEIILLYLISLPNPLTHFANSITCSLY